MKTILLVDDEYALVEMLTESFQAQGYRVVSATDGKDGLAQLQKEKPDLVITDFMMPIADGRELIKGMRALTEFRSTPVVMMSSMSKAVSLSTVRDRLEVAAYIRKPASWAKLLETVVRLLDKEENRTSAEDSGS